MKLDDIYTPLEEAKKEIKERWKNKELEKKVDNFLKGDIPDFLQNSPKAYLARHISSPNMEFMRFKDIAKDMNMEYILSECLDDRYISINSLKYHLGKMFFHEGINKNGEKIFTPKVVVDFTKANKMTLKEVDSTTGKKLVDLHHDILFAEFPETKESTKDISDWLKRNGTYAGSFYMSFLALFMRNGILFENYLMNEEERKLTEGIIIPAVEKLTEVFGFKPLIVRLLPEETENDPSWCYYHGHIKSHLDDKDKNKC